MLYIVRAHFLLAVALCAALFAAAGCNVGDDTPPAPIDDLTFESATRLILWTSTGDDGDGGRATVHDLRFFDEASLATFLGLSSLDGVDEATIASAFSDNFDQAIQIQNEPVPEEAGTQQQMVIPRLDITGGTTFYLAMNARDEVGNNSGPSNVVAVNTAVVQLEIRLQDATSCFGASVAGDDFNDDDINDILVGDPCQGKVYLFYGKEDLADPNVAVDQVLDLGGPNTADVVFIGDPAEGFGAAVGSIENTVGDASKEIVIGMPDYNAGTGRVFIIAGNTDGLPQTVDFASGADTADITITGENPGDLFGSTVLNAEGFEGRFKRDLVVGAPGYASSRGRVYLFRADDLSEGEQAASVSKAVIDGEAAGDMFGSAVDLVGEMDDDSLEELAVGSPGVGKIYVVFGDSDFSSLDLSTDLSTVTVLAGSAADGFGTALSGGSDLDGFVDPDTGVGGPADLVVGVPGDAAGTGKVLLFSGSDIADAKGTGVPPAPVVEITGGAPGDAFGTSVADLGDVNPAIVGDQRDEGVVLDLIDNNGDFLVGAPGTANGTVYLFAGSDSLPATMSTSDALLTFEGASPGASLGRLVLGLGDVTDDGFTDFAACADGSVLVLF